VKARQLVGSLHHVQHKIDCYKQGDYDDSGCDCPSRQMLSFEVVGSNRIFERNHGAFLLVPTQRLSHVVGVFLAVLARRVVVENGPIHLVTKLLIHRNGDFVRHSDKEIDEIALLGFGRFLQNPHQIAGQTQSPKLGRHCQRRHVTMPRKSLSIRWSVQSSRSLRFSHNVAHEFSGWVFSDGKVLRPSGQVLEVE